MSRLVAAIIWASVGSIAAIPPVRGQAKSLGVSDRPTITIGREGDPAYEFTRIAQAIELPGRQLVVVDGGRTELRIFAPNGSYLRSLGRSGSGPGEFRMIGSVMAAGDTLIVWDGSLRRLTRYLADGTLVITLPVNVRDPDRYFNIVGRMPNGAWLVSSATVPRLDRPAGTYRDSTHFGVLRGEKLDWVATSPGPMLFVYKPDRTAARGLAVGAAAFTAWPQTRSLGGRVLVFDGADVDVLTLTGEPVNKIPVPITAKRVTREDVSRALDADVQRERAELGRAITKAKYASDVVPTHAPRYSNVLIGTTDEFWLQEFPLDENAPTRFVGVRLNGEIVGRFLLPPRSRLLHVGTDFIWAVVANEDGVEILQRRSLTR